MLRSSRGIMYNVLRFMSRDDVFTRIDINNGNEKNIDNLTAPVLYLYLIGCQNPFILRRLFVTTCFLVLSVHY